MQKNLLSFDDDVSWIVLEWHRPENCSRNDIDPNDIDDIDDIEGQEECKQMMIAEIQNRSIRVAFDDFINRFIEYQPYRKYIYSCCYVNSDLR